MSSKDGSLVSKQPKGRRISAQESTIQQQRSDDDDELNQSQSQFECPICIHWLNEPVLTSCGHRFCKKCITAWLEKPNPCCPIDNRPLAADSDIFPDNYTRREIQQLRRACSNAGRGCAVVLSPIELDAHRLICTYGSTQPQRQLLECRFLQFGCSFVASDAAQLDEHLGAELVMHLNLLSAAYHINTVPLAETLPDTNNSTVTTTSPMKQQQQQQQQHHAWDAPDKQTNNGDQHAANCAAVANATSSDNSMDNHQQQQQQLGAIGGHPTTTTTTPNDKMLFKALYERIVLLEQQSREKDSKLERLSQQLAHCLKLQTSSSSSMLTLLKNDNATAAPLDPRYSGGVLVWRIDEFHSKVAAMRADLNAMFYSAEAYTSPHGYRFCLRINLSPKLRDHIGLHVHLMQSPNDYHLEWPFRGRIKISMIHPRLEETENDIIMSKPDLQAFHRPAQEISPRSFGFLEYASVSHVLNRGFVVDDVLTVKVHISIV